jgi:hypothetical protein
LESIIIFVLIAIASSVFQSFTKQAKQQYKQATPQAKNEAPKMQPTIKPIYQTKVHSNEYGRDPAAMVVKPKVQVSKPSVEPTLQSVSLQPSVLVNSAAPDMKAEQTDTAGASILEHISLSDMQRSIVMAEVLGKPAALRNIRR